MLEASLRALPSHSSFAVEECCRPTSLVLTAARTMHGARSYSRLLGAVACCSDDVFGRSLHPRVRSIRVAHGTPGWLRRPSAAEHEVGKKCERERRGYRLEIWRAPLRDITEGRR